MGSIQFVEKSFNGNDFYILTVIILSYTMIYFLPRLFKNRFITFLLLFYGITVASLFDNTIGATPFDYYDILDGPKYTVMDIVAYLIYGPYGYLFIYFHEKFHVRGKRNIVYIIVWTCIGVLIELLNVKFGVFTYKNGYRWLYSIPIYLYIQSVLLFMYKYIKH
ncbi:hypothetical protein [Bacillus suaedaesalsae]|uniref:Uncharacterized protein n=1 Tax=Bacillus suaedaesalsae TaxID=2810349 RepID=A0ABS2DCW4_9BACI|nr:hypothetical protein [Bacillus suaedaesalsae]MBM6616292.1 hypothetical protein [Bacillus suaedaesalsae]